MKSLASKITLTVLSLLVSFILKAQEKGLDVDINVNKHDNNWYQQPWVWIVAAAVFILLLVALTRGRKA